MTYTLVIVESPAKCSKIESYLGSGYKCMASFGHLTKLTSLKNIDIENNFNLTFNIIEEKAKQIAKLQKSINNANDIILATDDDREGEAIAWHICKLFKLNINTTKFKLKFN
jgi:DNA topoisomerase-1